MSRAESIAFRFTVRVSASATCEIELPFEVTEGDLISGRFTFDPGVSELQRHPVQFVVDGFVLTADSFRVSIFDANLRSAPFLVDFIIVGSDLCPLAEASKTSRGYGINFGDTTGDVLKMSAFPLADVDTWNAFDSRHLRLGFIDDSNPRDPSAFSISGHLSPLGVVPEPELLGPPPV